MAILEIILDRKTMTKISEQILPGPKPDVKKFLDELAEEMALHYEEGKYEQRA